MEYSKEEVRKLKNLAKKASQLSTVAHKERLRLCVTLFRCITLARINEEIRRAVSNLDENLDFTVEENKVLFNTAEKNLDKFFELTEEIFKNLEEAQELISLHCPNNAVEPF